MFDLFFTVEKLPVRSLTAEDTTRVAHAPKMKETSRSHLFMRLDDLPLEARTNAGLSEAQLLRWIPSTDIAMRITNLLPSGARQRQVLC